MSEKQTTTKALNGLFRKLMENGDVQGVQFLVPTIPARLPSPEEYGVVGVILMFVTIANVLVQSGLNTALVQKRKVDDTDFSSVSSFNMVISAVICLVLCLSMLGIAYFYNDQEMAALMRMLAVVLLPGGVIFIQSAYVPRNMAFKGPFISSSAASMISGAVSILPVCKGLGVQALVQQQIVYYLFYMLVLFMNISWKPHLSFNTLRIRAMFVSGWKLLCVSLLDMVYNNIYGSVVGGIYNESVLRNYNRGERFPKLTVNNLGTAIQSVMLPALSASQDEPECAKFMLWRAITVSSYLVLPTMVSLTAAAWPMVLLLLGEKWLSCVPFLQIMCITCSFWPTHIASLQVLSAMRRSDIFPKLEIVKKMVGLAVLVIGIRYNPLVPVALKAAADFLCTFINTWPNKRLLSYNMLEQWKGIVPSMAVSILTVTIVVVAGRYVLMRWLGLGMQILFGAVVYMLASRVSGLEVFRYVRGLAMDRLHGRK